MRHANLGATAIAGLLLAAAGGGSAQAGLLGKNLSVTYDYPDAATVYGSATYSASTFTVGPGVETVITVEGVTAISADFTDAHLHIVLNTVLSAPTWNTASFNGLIFTVLSGSQGFTAADVTAATTMAGFTDARVTLPGNQIRIDWNGLSYVDGTVVDIDFTSVPEPASLALLGAGMLGLGLARRRKAG
jgi:hypothetical protein